MSRVAIIGVGQSEFVRAYPGSVRELAFEGFKDAMRDARLTAKVILVPSDLSSAAFFIVAAGFLAGSELRMPDVGTNGSRLAV